MRELNDTLADLRLAARGLAEALDASGIDDPEDELQRWAKDPYYRIGLRPRLADGLVRRASQTASSEQRSMLIQRALALVPDHPAARALTSRRPSAHPRRWLVALVAAVAGALIVGGALLIARSSLS